MSFLNLSKYQALTSRPVLVNTSFNVHEEPIVCSPEDALKGFFEAALGYLYIEGVGIIPFKDNETVAIQYMQERMRSPSNSVMELKVMNQLLRKDLRMASRGLEEKEAVIQELKAVLSVERSARTQAQRVKLKLEAFARITKKLFSKIQK